MLEIERVRRIRDEVGHRPWHELGLEELARAAGVSRMTLHRHGIDKDSIRASLSELLISEYQAGALPALTSSEPAAERLELALRSICATDERYLGLIDALGDEDRDGIFHEPGEGEVLTRTSIVDALRRILEDGVRDGTLAVDDVDEMATLLQNATGWTYRHMRSGHRWSPERASSRVVSLLVAGVRA
jgi:AcrR family transcriptional regulator